MNLPTREQCFQFFKDFHTPLHVIKHSVLVNKVALWIAEHLIEAGETVDINLVDRASLLGDLLRMIDVKGIDKTLLSREVTQKDMETWKQQREEYAQLHHSQANYLVLRNEYPELAKLLRKDYYAAIIQEALSTWEEKIIYYADKRVRHDQIVGLATRLKESHQRFAEFRTDYQSIELSEFEYEIDKAIINLEAEIFKIIKKQPGDVAEVVKMEVEGTDKLLSLITMKKDK